MKIKYYLPLFLIALTQCLTATVSAQNLRGVVEGGQVRGMPIAIVPFKLMSAPSSSTTEMPQLDKIINRNLYASGKFEPLPSEKFLSFPSRKEEVRAKDWRLIDADALVIGEIWNIEKDLYEVQFRIFDVRRDVEIGTGHRIPSIKLSNFRSAAHIISDQVYKSLTGRPGAFNSRIAYVKKSTPEYQRDRFQLLVADWDGYGSVEVYGSWKPLLSPTWSPPGSKIAFVSFSKDGAIVQVHDLNRGKSEVIAAFKGVNSAPAWSPDGTKLAYSTSRHGSPDIYVYDFATRTHQRINTHWGIDTEPSWTPDGKAIMHTSSRSGKAQVYRYDIATEELVRQTFEGDQNSDASLDFDGKRMVMVHDGGEIVVADAQTGELQWITSSKFDESPSFSPNGDMVLYATEYTYQPKLMVSSSDGRIKTPLEFVSGDVREPAWSSLLR